MAHGSSSSGRQLREADGREALREHAARRAHEARTAYGSLIDEAAIMRMLADRAVVRYPTTIRFDAAPLQPGEFAYAEPQGDGPSLAYCVNVHPKFADRRDLLPMLIAYHIVRINYGDIATHEEAEIFGATLLGLDVNAYYDRLCLLADEIGQEG